MGGACRANGVLINMYTMFVRKLEGNRPLGKPRDRWEGNIKIKMDIREIGRNRVKWIHVAQNIDRGGLLTTQ
jgi:hypothetical protein